MSPRHGHRMIQTPNRRTHVRALTLVVAMVSLFAVVTTGPVSAAGNTTGAAGTKSSTITPHATSIPDEVVVTYHPGSTSTDRVRVHHALRSVSARTVYAGSALDGAVEVLELPAGTSESQAARVADSLTGVAAAESNAVYRIRESQRLANDPFYLNGGLWGMYGANTSPANPYGSNAAAAWGTGFTGSRKVYVAVIDEGTQITHPDLAANVWTNPYDPLDGIDNDGNGFVDDAHGWDFFNNDNSLFDPDPNNPFVDAHGTHVAGTIGAVGNNGIGVAGVNWNVSIIPIKFLGWDGGTAEDATRAVDYVVDLKERHGMNIVAINASWGGPEHPQFLQDALQRAGRNGIFFVNAVGEGAHGVNADTVDDYPAKFDCGVTYKTTAFDCIVAVTAMNAKGKRASWANWGPASVDLAAPGVEITSTVPYDPGYATWSGTSMAAPHVTGALALYAAAHRKATPQEIRDALFSTTVATKDFAGDTVTGGRLDVGAMLNH